MIKSRMSELGFFKEPFNFPGFCNGTSVRFPTYSSSCCSKHSTSIFCVVLFNSSGAYLTSSAAISSDPAARLLFSFFIANCASSKLMGVLEGLLSPSNGIVLECCCRRNNFPSVISLLHKYPVVLNIVLPSLSWKYWFPGFCQFSILTVLNTLLPLNFKSLKRAYKYVLLKLSFEKKNILFDFS